MARLASALEGRPGTAPVAAAALAAGTLLGVGAMLTAGSTAGSLVLAGAVAGAAVLLVLLTVTPVRVVDVLLLVAVATITLPIKKHFDVHPGIVGWPGFRVSAADLPLLLLLPLAALGWWYRRVRNAVPPAVLVIYGALLLQYLVSVLHAAQPEVASFEYASAVHALMLAVLVAALFRRSMVMPVLGLIAAQVIVHTAFAMAQAATGRPLGAQWFTDVSLVEESLRSGAVRIRPIGLFDHPIVYADMLMLWLPVLGAGLFIPAGRAWRTFLCAALAMGAAGLALTLSRGAWIATVVAGTSLFALALFAGLLSRRQVTRIVTAGAVVALLLAAAFGPRAYERLTASDEGNLNVRFELNWIALRMIAAHPFTGVGLNHVVDEMDAYDPANVKARLPGPTHNVYLLEGAEAGLPATILLAALFATIITIGVRRLPAVPHLDSRWMAAALVAGLIGFAVAQLADFSHRLEPLRSLLWMNVGLLFALVRLTAGDEAPRRA